MADSRKLIRQMDELPKSFDLGNYAATKLFTAKEWATALAGREHLDWLDGVEQSDWEPNANSFIEMIFKDPFFKSKSERYFKDFMPNSPVRRLSRNKFRKIAMTQELYFNKLQKQSTEMQNEYMNTGDAVLFRKQNHEFLANYQPIVDLVHGLPLGKKEIYLTVDLACSDKLLLKHFQQSLDLARAASDTPQIKQAFSSTDFARWHRFGVLPYIDLQSWAALNKVTITQHLMGAVLFPNDTTSDTTQTVRQTVKPLAEMLGKPETLSTLWAQIE